MDIILAIVDGIAQTLPTLIVQAANILIEICDALVQNLPAIVEAAISIVQALIDGLVSIAMIICGRFSAMATTISGMASISAINRVIAASSNCGNAPTRPSTID